MLPIFQLIQNLVPYFFLYPIYNATATATATTTVAPTTTVATTTTTVAPTTTVAKTTTVTTTVPPTTTKKTPGFEAIFAITGLLAIAYLLRRRQ